MASAGELEPGQDGDKADVVFSVQGRVATIRLNRPAKFNGWREMDTEIIRGLLERCMEDDAVGAVILTGTGTYYSAGATAAMAPTSSAASSSQGLVCCATTSLATTRASSTCS